MRVSPSRILHDRRRVQFHSLPCAQRLTELSESTRSRIQQICREEGYRVNALARSLICSKTNVLGLIVPEVTNPLLSELSLGVETHARSLDYNVMLCNSLNDPKNNRGAVRLPAEPSGGRHHPCQLAQRFDPLDAAVSAALPAVLLGTATRRERRGDQLGQRGQSGRRRLAAEIPAFAGPPRHPVSGIPPLQPHAPAAFFRICRSAPARRGQPIVVENPADASSITMAMS